MARHIEITTYLPCINHCSYCPQDKLKGTYDGEKILSKSNFKKVLENIPSDIEIHFSGFSEPAGHLNIQEMIELAKKKHEVVVYSSIMEEPQGVKKFVKQTINSVEKPISRAGNVFEYHGKGKKCGRNSEFKQNVMLPNGDVYLCCMDYGLEHKLGNLLETNFNELRRENEYDLCLKCEESV